MKPFYITTTLPYVNAEPHIGFAMEIIRADIIARSRRLAGQDVFFNTGTDEHGIKIYRKAKEQSVEPQAYCDAMAAKFKAVLPALGIMPEANFIRTTDPHHIEAAQAFWQLVDKNGYIYKKDYSVKYCVGCELEKTDSELVNGRCPLHPLTELEIIHEENYFFKWSAFQQKLLDLYKERPDFVVPDFRFNEIKAFVERGLEDFSISRVASKMPWGIPVPGDADQVMYVWFDALVNYISAVGWPDRTGDFKKWWNDADGVVQYCGKDNLRQQSAMWQAMLMAADIKPSRQIVIDGFVTGEGGIKMSKSLGNTVDPLDIVKEYGTDALRYYVARELSPFEDSPFTKEKFKEAFNAGLANGIGNLVSRIMTLSEKHLSNRVVELVVEDVKRLPMSLFNKKAFEDFNIHLVCQMIWNSISKLDQQIAKEEVFKVIKVDEERGKEMLQPDPKGPDKHIGYIWQLANIAFDLEPILPETSKKIIDCMLSNKKPTSPLFARK